MLCIQRRRSSILYKEGSNAASVRHGGPMVPNRRFEDFWDQTTVRSGNMRKTAQTSGGLRSGLVPVPQWFRTPHGAL